MIGIEIAIEIVADPCRSHGFDTDTDSDTDPDFRAVQIPILGRYRPPFCFANDLMEEKHS